MLGIRRKSLSNRKCGVFVGAAVGDYGAILRRDNPALSQSAFAGIGLTSSILAARISYLLNLKGPSISLDTACSSSLVALHQACRSIQSGDCEMALVGGINLILDASQIVTTSKMQMLSPHGRCRPFDHRADGIALSEGIAVLILKPLEKADRGWRSHPRNHSGLGDQPGRQDQWDHRAECLIAGRTRERSLSPGWGESRRDRIC